MYDRLKAIHIRYAMAGLLLSAVSVSILLPGQAGAFAALTNKSIQLTSSLPGATNVVHKVGFTTVTDGQTVGSVVIVYCGEASFVNESCSSPPAGFDSNEAALTVNNISGGITGLSVHANTTPARVVLTRTASTVANGAHSFDLGTTAAGLTNPSATNTTYYAKIYVYVSTDGTGEPTDAGGVAISTANPLDLTAKVMEYLVFCVYTNSVCADGGTAVPLGDSFGTLSNPGVTYTNTAKFDLGSNVANGISVRLKGNTLKSGSNQIDPHGSTCAGDSLFTTIEQFGIRMSSVGAGQTAVAPYDCASGSHTLDTAATNTLFGQEIVKTATTQDASTSVIEFAAKSANTTESGVYEGKYTLIATGKY